MASMRVKVCVEESTAKSHHGWRDPKKQNFAKFGETPRRSYPLRDFYQILMVVTKSVLLFMAALRSRCGHYISALWFLLLLLLSSFSLA